ncbi:MAG: DUF4258 domain-containing protein [Chloroflexota bacterium]|nr:DUF4258 domain-containing protein [Chloroflexota bacterium]
MYYHILKQVRENIRNNNYVMTLHAEEEMDNDNLTIFDIEGVILTGKIIERQRDHKTSEWKYLIEGLSLDNITAVVVAKMSPTNTLVIITVYRI